MSAEQSSRERARAEAFVTLADTLVTDYDVIDVLHRLTSSASTCSGSTRPGCCCPTSAAPFKWPPPPPSGPAW
jgi:hypothetical protein